MEGFLQHDGLELEGLVAGYIGAYIGAGRMARVDGYHNYYVYMLRWFDDGSRLFHVMVMVVEYMG